MVQLRCSLFKRGLTQERHPGILMMIDQGLFMPGASLPRSKPTLLPDLLGVAIDYKKRWRKYGLIIKKYVYKVFMDRAMKVVYQI